MCTQCVRLPIYNLGQTNPSYGLVLEGRMTYVNCVSSMPLPFRKLDLLTTRRAADVLVCPRAEDYTHVLFVSPDAPSCDVSMTTPPSI